MNTFSEINLTQPKYVTYTTAEIERMNFAGEVSPPAGGSLIAPAVNLQQVTIRIIDGRPCILVDAPLPGTVKPSRSAGLFRYIDEEP